MFNPGVIKIDSVRQPREERDRQKFRRERIHTSRFLDNYFNWGIHGKCWLPNGVCITKKYLLC